MARSIERFTVLLNPTEPGEPTEHEVEVRWADQLRGELEAPKHGITMDQPMHMTTVWVWAACHRLGLINDQVTNFRTFKDFTLVDLTPLKAVKVPPTPQAAPDGSA